MVTKNDLADFTYNDNPTLLMKQNIEVGEYDLFISLRNMISEIDLSKKDQEKLYIDVEFCNTNSDDLIFKINKLGYQIPQSAMQLEPLSRYRNDVSWSCINAYSDYFQKKFETSDYIQDGKYDFVTHFPKPLPDIYYQNIIVKPGENHWLLGDSRQGMLAGQVFLLLSNFKVVSGGGVIKIAAFVDINNYDENSVSNGKFITEIRNNVKSYRYYKGVANSSTVMETNLEYDINSDTKKNIKLPVEVSNQFVNCEGTNVWITNLNPWMNRKSAAIISESDMFKFEYNDDFGLWYFDTFHTDFPNEIISSCAATSSCNLGNWGATNRYNIKINNQNNYGYNLEYYLQTGSDVIIISNDTVKIKSHVDMSENIMAEVKRYYSSDINKYRKFLALKNLSFSLKSEEDILPEKIIDFFIGPYESKIVSFDVTLCTNCDGCLKNYLKLIRNEK